MHGVQAIELPFVVTLVGGSKVSLTEMYHLGGDMSNQSSIRGAPQGVARFPEDSCWIPKRFVNLEFIIIKGQVGKTHDFGLH